MKSPSTPAITFLQESTSHGSGCRPPVSFLQPGGSEAGTGRGLGRVVSDRLDRTPFHGFLAESFLFGSLGLLEHIGMAAIVIAGEVCRGCLATEIAIDALIVAIVGAWDILGIFVGYISHSA